MDCNRIRGSHIGGMGKGHELERFGGMSKDGKERGKGGKGEGVNLLKLVPGTLLLREMKAMIRLLEGESCFQSSLY